ncbi:MAG: radical SAM protein [Oscillospiraceae bacterium]|nr:radical SAM protein [Oscillospiraceae bacterium]
MQYEGTVYRPPSEARSLIIQITIGCRHNGCTFCTMYKDKIFRIRSGEEVYRDLEEMSRLYGDLPLRIFLADGDALTVDTDYLLEILAWIRRLFPGCTRITAYGTAADVIKKTLPELIALKEAGLAMVYLGAESGDDEILRHIRKGLNADRMVKAGLKLKEAGILLSLTLISGIGGRKKLEDHALQSAGLVSKIKSEYLGFLTLLLEDGAPMLKEIETGEMELLRPEEVLTEMKLFLSHVDSEGTLFRSNHPSNYLNLRGELNRDISQMIRQIDMAAENRSFRPESWRGL